MPRNSPTGFVMRLLRRRHRLCADLAHLVAGRRSASLGAYATFVVFAWRDDDEYDIPAEEVARIDRGQPRRPRAEALREARAAHDRRRRNRRPTGSAGWRWTAARRPAAGQGGPASKRIDRRLRLLDLPAQRHRHVLGVLRHLRGAGRRDRRRARRARSCSTCGNVALRRRRACCSRASPAASPAWRPRRATSCSGPRSAWRSPSLLGAGFLALEMQRVRRAWSRTATGRSAAPSCRRSSRWSAATALHVTAGLLWLRHHDGAGRWPRASAPTSCAGCSASPCSGTPSTSSGSASSPSSIWWEPPHERHIEGFDDALPGDDADRRPARQAPTAPP